ncbi:MAG: CoA-binding protein [Candidatus Bathyarchaeia archaeon]
MSLGHDAHSDSEVKAILELRNVAVVGISRDPAKPAHFVPKYLREHGYNIIPVNPSAQEILGLRCYASLLEVREPIDIVDVFRPSEDVPPVVEAALKRGVKVVWLQEGIHNAKAEGEATAQGTRAIWNRCMMKEHARLFGEKPGAHDSNLGHV